MPMSDDEIKAMIVATKTDLESFELATKTNLETLKHELTIRIGGMIMALGRPHRCKVSGTLKM